MLNEWKRQLAEMEAQMDAEGVEDATAWEHWDEYERVLYAVGEYEVALKEREFESQLAEETAEIDEMVALAELANEAAMVELEQLGCIGFDTALSDAEWNETSGEFWEFAVDLYDEPRAYVLTELF